MTEEVTIIEPANTLKSDLRGIEIIKLYQKLVHLLGLKSDLRGIEIKSKFPKHLQDFFVKIRP